MSCPSRIMPAKSVAVTSPLTGPLTMSQIFLRFARKSPGSFASSDGFVVTPSRMPSDARASMSLMLPVSANSFIGSPDLEMIAQRAVSSTRFDGALTLPALSTAWTA